MRVLALVFLATLHGCAAARRPERIRAPALRAERSAAAQRPDRTAPSPALALAPRAIEAAWPAPSGGAAPFSALQAASPGPWPEWDARSWGSGDPGAELDRARRSSLTDFFRTGSLAFAVAAHTSIFFRAVEADEPDEEWRRPVRTGQSEADDFVFSLGTAWGL